MTVNLTGVTNVQTITVTLSSVSDGTSTGDVAVLMGMLIGDTTADRVVNTTDIKSGQDARWTIGYEFELPLRCDCRWDH